MARITDVVVEKASAIKDRILDFFRRRKRVAGAVTVPVVGLILNAFPGPFRTMTVREHYRDILIRQGVSVEDVRSIPGSVGISDPTQIDAYELESMKKAQEK